MFENETQNGLKFIYSPHYRVFDFSEHQIVRSAPVHAQDFLILTGLKEDWKTVYAMDAGSYKQHRKNACKTEGDDSGQDDLKRITYEVTYTVDDI